MSFALLDRIRRSKEHWSLGLVLLFGLIHGLIFTFLIPPWQHYDEPGHFEFAWLLAHRAGLPHRDEYDQGLRRELAASMIEHGFFDQLNFRPNLLSQDEPIWIGISQTGDRPIYHFLASLPLRLVSGSDVAFQLHLARLISLLLYLITIVAAYGLMVALTPPTNPLRWMAPASLVLIPGFVELMTALNNDVGATAFFSLFLWVSVRLIQRGFSWLRAAVAFTTAALCFWTENTVMIAAVLLILPLTFAILRKRRLAWILIAFGFLALIPTTIGWGDAAQWYQPSLFDTSSRIETDQAPLGKAAFRINYRPDEFPAWLIQVLTPEQADALGGKTVSLGAWIWASEPVRVRTPLIQTPSDNRSAFQFVEVSREPAFFVMQTTIGENSERMRVILAPLPEQEVIESPVTIYYDGLILVEGERPHAPLHYENATANSGQWGEQKFTNLLRNPSAERAWPRVRSRVDRLISSQFPSAPSQILAALLDWSPSAWYFGESFQQLAQSFWARFGWGHVTLTRFRNLAYRPYTILGIITLVGLIGAVWAAIREIFQRGRQVRDKEAIFFLGLSAAILWGSAFLRGANSIWSSVSFIPSARYAYPAIIPTVLLLNLGWLEAIRQVNRRLRLRQGWLFGVYLLFFFGLDILAWLSITRFYGR